MSLEYSHPSSPFTCLSCSILFDNAEQQREHYKSDHHRYNMKRRVAGLPPLSATVFNQKVLEKRTETAVMASSKGSACQICGKQYNTDNAYQSHLSSRRHRENVAKASSAPRPSQPSGAVTEGLPSEPQSQEQELVTQQSVSDIRSAGPSLHVDPDASEEQLIQTIDEKIAAARARLAPTQCLFCSASSSSMDDNLTHMSFSHSFFIPDAEYLVDLVGLITYLGEKIAVGNVCIYCNANSREFRTLDAVRKHMSDKGHCKLAYDSEQDRLEISDFYDFTASYPDAHKRTGKEDSNSEEEWEDTNDDVEVDEVVHEDVTNDSSSESDLPDNQITYGDNEYELVLASGARIGHRSMRRYYAQSFPRAPRGGQPEDPNSGAALVRRLLDDKNSALVPRKGGFGAFGGGTDVVKARNRGEAREAGRHIREFRDQRRKEDFKTKVGFIHNSQKHYRDPLLQ